MAINNKTRLYILPLGYIENDVALNLLLHNQATSNDKHKAAEWHRVPSFYLLIIHPKLGNILVDTGSHPDAMNGYWPEETRQLIPLIRDKKDLLDSRLAELKLSPADIDLLILTHLHLDHAGGLCYFSGTRAGKKVIAHTQEIKQALYDTFICSSNIANGYMRPDFCGLPDIHFDPLVDTTSLADDLELIWLPSHTAGTLGVLIHLENSGTIFYTSDAVNWEANLYPEPNLSSVFYDSLQMKNSVHKIRWLQRRFDAQLIFGHDFAQYQKLKLSPNQYYD